MSSDGRKRPLRNDLLLASLLVAAGLVLSGTSLVEIARINVRVAQGTQPLKSSPSAAPDTAPAESKPGGERPSTPAPEPNRPDARAQKEGAKPALPPAPAEKFAPPIRDR